MTGAFFLRIFIDMASRKDPNAVTDKEAAYVRAIVSGKSHAEAYVSSYNVKSKSFNTINKSAHTVFNRPQVQRYYKKLVRQAENEAIMDRVEAQKVLSRIGRAKLRDLVNLDGEIDPDAYEDSGQEVAELHVVKSEHHNAEGGVTYNETTKVKLRDPIKSIERLSKMNDWDKQKGLTIDNINFVLDTGIDDEDEDEDE